MKNSFNLPLTQFLDRADIMAIKALDAGNANERQQRIVLNAIFNKICRVGKNSFCGESQMNTAFNEGVRYVGIQLHSAVLCDVDKLKLNNASPINQN